LREKIELSKESADQHFARRRCVGGRSILPRIVSRRRKKPPAVFRAAGFAEPRASKSPIKNPALQSEGKKVRRVLEVARRTPPPAIVGAAMGRALETDVLNEPHPGVAGERAVAHPDQVVVDRDCSVSKPHSRF